MRPPSLSFWAFLPDATRTLSNLFWSMLPESTRKKEPDMSISPEALRRIGEATGRFATILAEAIRNNWSEDRVIEEIQRSNIVSDEGLQAMRAADAARDAYIGG